MKLLRPLLRHQIAPLEFAVRTPDPFLAMAMRTGKTLVAIRALRKRIPQEPKLVIAPLTVLIPWEDELRKEGLPHGDLGDARVREELANFGPRFGAWYLVGPARLRQEPWILQENRWGGIVIDESTIIKNPKAEIARLVNSVQVAALSDQIRMCLSGWPCPEGEEDWFEQMRFLGHGYFMGCNNFWQWRHRNFRPLDYDWAPRPGAREKIKAALKGRVFFLTAKEAGMPDRFVEEKRMIELEPDQREVYEQVERDFAAVLKDKVLSTKWVPVKELRLHQIASGEVPWDDGSKTTFNAKVEELLWLFKNDLKKERRVVFFRFQAGVDAVRMALEKSKIPCRSITGATSQAERREALDAYREGRTRTLLLQADCGRYALDLSAGSVGIFYSLGHSFETFVQARQRFKHPLKKESNLLIYLISKGTLEERIPKVLAEKGMTGKFFFNRICEDLKERHR